MTEEAQKSRINQQSKSATYGGQIAPLLKHSRWGMKSCGGQNKTAAQTFHTMP